jgi:hypothetical protein
MVEMNKSFEVLRGGFILSGVNEYENIKIIMLYHPTYVNGFVVGYGVNIESADADRVILGDCDRRITLDYGGLIRTVVVI